MSLSVEIKPIHSKDIDLYWDNVKPLIQKAVDLEHGCYDIDHVYSYLKSGEKSLWIIFVDKQIKAAVTTRIEEYPTGLKVCVIDYAGGEGFKEYWENFTNLIEPLYKSLGCGMMTIAGRRGWERFHTDKGYKFIYQVLGKAL
jgi:hypothetical protein